MNRIIHAGNMKLSDKYTLERGSVYLTGIQALVRLPIDQMRRDRRAGLNTGAFISGYEGSPLGGYDMALARAGKLLLDEHSIHFVPGVNEDLAATSVFGSQIYRRRRQVAKYDGVVGIWYGKGPGVDRSGDIFRHANLGRHRQELRRAGAGRRRSRSPKAPPSRTRAISASTTCGMPFFYPGQHAGDPRLRPARPSRSRDSPAPGWA